MTFGTWLAAAGTAPRVHMELMRHTDMRLTMGFYTDPRLLDTSRALADLPDLETQGEQKAAVALRKGTDDMPVDWPEKSNDSDRVSECPEGSIRDPEGCAKAQKTPVKQGFLVGAVGFRFAAPALCSGVNPRPCVSQLCRDPRSLVQHNRLCMCEKPARWTGFSHIGATVRTLNAASPSSRTSRRSCTRQSRTSFASTA